MFKRGFILMVCLLMGYQAVQAQSPTPTQDTGAIYQYRVEVFLPAAIHFFANIASNSQNIERVELHVFQAGGFDVTLPVDVQASIIGGSIDTTEVRVPLLLTTEQMPQLFEPISYEWQIEIADQEPSQAVGEFVFAPKAPEAWQSAGEAPITLYWHNPRLGGLVIYEDLGRVYQLLQAHTGHAPTLKAAIYEASDELCRLQPDTNQNVIPGADEYECSVEALQALFAAQGFTLIKRPDNEFDTLQQLLIQAAVEKAYSDQWSRFPAWFGEGLAQFYRPYGGARELATARFYQTQDQLIGLDSEPTAADQALWSAQSYLFLLYLADTYGANVPFELAQAENFEAAFENITGASFADTERAWQDWLTSQLADRAVAWSPYLQTTPTTTPTRTPTPIPPTRTPTHTPTITQTPTSSSLVNQEPTRVVITAVVPTLAQPTTPTNTPRPPGSLPTLAPTPAPASEDEGGGLPCGTSALVIPVGVVVFLGKKRRR